jgi:hypothetical protein
MIFVLSALLAVHGLIHGLGFVKAFGLKPVPQLRADIGRFAGVLWLISGALFIAAAVLLLAVPLIWWVPAAAAIVLSQGLIVGAWRDARAGSLVNGLLLIPVAVAALGHAPGNFQARYQQAIAQEAAAPRESERLTEADLATLPEPVKGYLRRARVVGQPKVHAVKARFRGEIRSKIDGPWMPFTAVQQDFFDRPSRYFLLGSTMFGVPFDALHIYRDGVATFEVKAASVVTMVDARGPEMNRSETVTFFNDMCVLAPATLIDPSIAWTPIDAKRVKATFTRAGQRISAELHFDEAGDLVNFTSDDRMQTEDGKTYRAFRWSTPLSGYRDYGAARLAERGEASWATPEGELPYGKFELLSVEYTY